MKKVSSNSTPLVTVYSVFWYSCLNVFLKQTAISENEITFPSRSMTNTALLGFNTFLVMIGLGAAKLLPREPMDASPGRHIFDAILKEESAVLLKLKLCSSLHRSRIISLRVFSGSRGAGILGCFRPE